MSRDKGQYISLKPRPTTIGYPSRVPWGGRGPQWDGLCFVLILGGSVEPPAGQAQGPRIPTTATPCPYDILPKMNSTFQPSFFSAKLMYLLV